MRPKGADPECIPKEAKIQKCECANTCDIFGIIFKWCLPMQKWQTDISYAFWRIASVRNVENTKLICKKVCTPHTWGALKIMWLCVRGWHNLTNQRTGPISLHRIWNAWDTFPNSRHQLPKAMTALNVLRLLALRRKEFIICENYHIQWLLLIFLTIFSASLSGSDKFFSFWLIGCRRCFICKCFMRYSNFAHKLNS